MMDLDRGTLARLDRKLLARPDNDGRYQMVRVPVTPAVWSTWKRYCDAVGISMGRAIAELINGELASVCGVSGDGAMSRFERVERRLVEREEALDRRERRLEEGEERLRTRSEHLRRSEYEIRARERGPEAEQNVSDLGARTVVKTGRNEPRPCGSGDKYKRCHGTSPRQTLRSRQRRPDGA